jgi:hypothetical protein
MSSIIREGNTFHGISVAGRGVFTNDEYGRWTYAGQHRDGHSCGLGMATWSNGSKTYAEHGPGGQFDGRCLARWADGGTRYNLYERGKSKEHAYVFADGTCSYNGEVCRPDDPRLLALIALVAPVEVRPAARAPHPPSPATRPQAIVRWIGRLGFAAAGARRRRGHRGAPRRRTPSLVSVSVRHNPTAAARVRAGLT